MSLGFPKLSFSQIKQEEKQRGKRQSEEDRAATMVQGGINNIRVHMNTEFTERLALKKREVVSKS